VTDDEHELERPFVTTTEHGGPHDDESYLCGFEMGQLDAILNIPHIQNYMMIFQTASVKQADLIAMHHNFKMEVESQEDEWTTANFYVACACDDPV
jgi:hypothetical protein